MSAFEYLSVALSFVLGFGVTRLLLGAVSVFKSRRTRTPHWIPLVWAAAIFVYQLQFWWALFELNETIPVWTHVAFVTAMAHALLLFVAGALALPVSDNGEPATLIDYFEQDGRCGLCWLCQVTLRFLSGRTGPFSAQVHSLESVSLSSSISLRRSSRSSFNPGEPGARLV